MQNKYLLAPLLMLFACDSSAGNSPKEIGEQFCRFTIDEKSTSIEDILSPALSQLITKTEAKNDEIAKAYPDEKPPFGDGIPYQTHPDYAPKCEVGLIIQADSNKHVEIKHILPDEPKANWTDRLVLKQVNEEWVIDDILYSDNKHQTGLRKILKDFISE